MRNSRISSRVSRVSELPSAGGKLVSTESQSPTKQIGVRSPRCLGPSSPFAYLKEPDFMNIAPLDARSGKLSTIPVKNSTYSKKRRNLDTTLQDIGKDLENITFLFQEITPQAPIKIDKTEKKLVPKETGLQILESVLEWLKAASFDLSWAKTAIEEKDLDNSNDAVQSLLYDSMRSLDKLRTIHNKLMVTFNDYFRYTRTRNRAAELAAEQKLSADAEQKADSLPPTKSNSGVNFSALTNDVVDLLQRERTKTAETYESRLKSLNATLLSQAGLIKKLTENLKGKGLYEVPRDSKPEPEIEIQVSKKTLKQKKKQRDGASDDEGTSKQTSEDSAKESQNKELLSLQKTLHTCQLDSSRLLQQNRALIETRKELTSSNQHKDKVIGELKAKLLHSELADKPKLDKLVVAAPKQPRETPAKSERPVSPRSRIIYVDSGERSGSPGPPPPEPPARPMMELLAQRKGASKLYTDDDDDSQESGEGRAAFRGKRSGDVSDSGEFEKDEKEKKRVPGDVERVWSGDKDEFGDVGRTRDADKTEKYTGTRDLEKTTSDRSVVTGAGGRVVSGPDGAGGRVVSGPDGAGGRVVSGPDGAGGRVVSGPDGAGGSVVSGPDGAGGRVVSGPDGAGGRVVSGPDGAGGRVVSGPDGQGTKEGKGRDRRGKDATASEAAGAGGADAAAAGREKVGGSGHEKELKGAGSGHEKELKGAEDRAAGKAREGSRGGGSSVTGQEAHEGSDSAVGQRSKRLLSAGGSGGGSGGGSDRGSAGGSGRGSAGGSDRGSGGGSGRGSGGGSGRGSGGGSAGGSGGGRKSSDGSLPAVGQLNDQSRDRMIKLDRDGLRSDRVGGKTSLTDASSHGRFSGGMVGQDPGDMMMIGGIRGRPTAGDEKESDRQLRGYALGGEIRPGGIVGVGRQVWERDGGGKGGLSDFAFGVSKYSQDRSQARERDQHAQVRYGTPDRDFGRGLDGFEGRSLAFGAVGGKGMQDMGADVGYLPTGRPGSAGQQTSGFKYNLSAFMPQQMGQQVGWLAGEKEGVVPFTEYPLRGLRVIGTTALQCERPDTEKGLTGAFPVIQPLKDSAGIARVLRSYDVNLNDPNTFEQQLEFIKHSGTMDGLREAMKLLAPHLKLLGENEQGENVLMDVMRALQKRHVELITEEFQPATGVGTTETKQRKRLTFVTDRRQDICSARARQRSLLTQSQARGLVHLKPLLGHETNALSPCPPYLPAGYMEALPQKMMRDTFPHTLPHKAQRQQRVTKLRQGSQYLINRMTIDNLLKTIDKLAKVVTS